MASAVGFQNVIWKWLSVMRIASEAASPMATSFSCISWREASVSRRMRRSLASLSSRSMAGTSRVRLPLVMKSWAPALRAVTATSSPMVPDTRMKGMSMPVRLRSDSASMPLKRGSA